MVPSWVAASGGGARHAAALGLVLRQADQLVADDLVREAQGALQAVERATGRHHLDDEVVAGLLAIDRVGELALPPPVRPAVDRAAGGRDAVGHRLDPRLRLRVLDVAVDDDHELVRTHHACWTSLRTRWLAACAGPRDGAGRM